MSKVIIHDSKNQRWLEFQQPEAIIQAHCLQSVLSQWQLVNKLVEEKKLYAVGFFSYEAASAFDDILTTHVSKCFPLMWFGLYQEAKIISLPQPQSQKNYILDWLPSVSVEQYHRDIAKIKEYIACGDTYQVNYTMRLQADFAGDAWELFLQLVRGQKADYAAYLELPDFTICSVSPELFFQREGEQIVSRPMKGTIARGYNIESDRQMAQWLQQSEKNRAENLMIVDMIRNDLGKIAKLNSVKVTDLFTTEKYPTVWQMTSTVTATTDASLVEIIKALFPCASITGAPKARTMEIIRQLEQTPRNIYTGSIGFINPELQAQFNVAIRTVSIDKKKQQAEYGVGGGIVWDSLIEDEYNECLVKARVLTNFLPNFSLLETILWTHKEEYFLLDYHLRRLNNSAIYFDFVLNLEEIEKQLFSLSNCLPERPHKVRLTVQENAQIALEAEALEEICSGKIIKLKLSPTPINTNNIFLYHKTTNREIYQRARASVMDCDDVLLWNEREEITETSIANIVVQIEGKLYTAPRECGLLSGTFRDYLLDEGKIEEKIITIKDLTRCDAIYRINSIRKWQEALVRS